MNRDCLAQIAMAVEAMREELALDERERERCDDRCDGCERGCDACNDGHTRAMASRPMTARTVSGSRARAGARTKITSNRKPHSPKGLWGQGRPWAAPTPIT